MLIVVTIMVIVASWYLDRLNLIFIYSDPMTLLANTNGCLKTKIESIPGVLNLFRLTEHFGP
jgi:hypothetical protein